MLGRPIEELALIPSGKAQVVSNYAYSDQVFLIRARSCGENNIFLMHNQGTALNRDLINNLANTYAFVSPCGDGSFCCENRTVANQCCGRNEDFFVIDGKAVSREARSSALDIVSFSSIKATPPSSSSTALSISPSTASVFLSSTALLSLSAAAKPSYQIVIIVEVALANVAVIAFMTEIVVLIWIYCKKRRAQIHGT